ncbi:peptide-methionine (S)-S-oxide reductase MsrA [Roseisolibacter sp. H3M3-2]|uniref:peptide-methionine (S)-S-oxide reductase MsrA n=1 Tax=Roseisolibacter sp. H3M3-2 TaxID=3031323 RepID=UPI0023DC837D|nr:peptide-methionine (S)-S-oxide reductase MsrA [Roseisolibacter sp. H3M3-2]MDF1505383.1 peptide-methionine (S)-S-oxide reductase MsrA [Roseisolibacter sp. H3M3-2]
MTSHTSPAVATLGGGCFWCLDAVYRRLRGVLRVESGYAGGHVDAPSYEEVCGKRTGHVEVVQVTFDPAVVSYRELLEVFFAIHDPTTPDRQGNDVGPQYRSVIFTHDDAQRADADAVIAELTRDDTFGAPIVTHVLPAPRFWPAEGYHQDYYARNARQGYCQVVIAPKVAKLRAKFADKLAAA